MTQPSAPSTVESTVRSWQAPPATVRGILRRLGPGLIIAGSIVGSGELIATTKTGADAGFSLLWLILIGCVIKVFVQIELGRFTISEGNGTMDAMNMVPGPRARVSWLVWYWLVMYLASAGQLGGILGGVGQSLALSVPLSGDFKQVIDDQPQLEQSQRDYDTRLASELDALQAAVPAGSLSATTRQRLRSQVVTRLGKRPQAPYTYDDVYWSAVVALVTAVLLVNGRYGMIQSVATFLVASFTLVTIFNVWALPRFSQVSFSWPEVLDGLRFRPPPVTPDGRSPVATALATFGIIGVGASELVTYPYWCLEKGYARFTGPREAAAAWVERARGWMRVMHWDAWCSMVIYTFATMAFYVLGAAVLHPRGLSPAGHNMISTLATMYEDVFHPWGDVVFLFGAISVLYSTVFVATAGNTRVAADALRVYRLGAATESARHWWIRLMCGTFPFIYLGVYMLSKDPVTLVLISGLTQAIMLPMLGGAALYYRYRRCDPRIAPGRLWDLMLWLSVAGLLVAGTWGAAGPLKSLVSGIAYWIGF